MVMISILHNYNLIKTFVRLLIINAICVIAILLLVSGCDDSNPVKTTESGYTKVSSNISNDTLWSTVNSPYIVARDVTVKRGATLTIEAGVQVRFDGYYSLIIEGILIANGTNSKGGAAAHIVFTSSKSYPDIRDWKGIKFYNTNDDKSILKYVRIEYAYIALDLLSSSPHITDSLIANNVLGIKLLAPPAIEYNLIKNNTIGINAPHAGYRVYITKNVITQNEKGVISTPHNMIQHNNLAGNNPYAIMRNNEKPRNILFALGNWWGSTDIDAIEALIYDNLDDAKLGSVHYLPIAKSEIPDAGPRLPIEMAK